MSNAPKDEQRARSVNGPRGLTAEQRFWRDVDKRGPDECWPWKRSTMRGGYGRFPVTSRNQQRAHRYAYELTHGPIPKDIVICHRCDNPPCCNPAHLFAGTHADNVRDRVAKGRSSSGEKHSTIMKRVHGAA